MPKAELMSLRKPRAVRKFISTGSCQLLQVAGDRWAVVFRSDLRWTRSFNELLAGCARKQSSAFHVA
jgi:hypothetical protein